MWKRKRPENIVKNEKNFYLPKNILNSKPIEELQKEFCFEGEEIFISEARFKNVPDTREKVKDVREYPYCCIGLVTGKFGNNVYQGSGCLISPRIVLTCAHNLYDRSKGEGADL